MLKLTPFLFLVSLSFLFLLPPTDPDLGWHLRCGQEIWQGHGFCRQNHFTVLLENYSWPNHAWGYQAIIYPIWSALGGYGLTVFNALLMTAAFGFLFAAYRCSSAIHCALGILATIYFGWGVFSFGIRSQLLGFFFFNLTLLEVAHFFTNFSVAARPWRAPPSQFFRAYIALPLTMLLWANTHGSVILGLILIGWSILTATADHLDKPYILKTLIPIFLASAGATLVNPFGFGLYEEMWRHFAGPIDLSKLIAEWVPQPQTQQIILISGAVVFLYLLLKLAAGGTGGGRPVERPQRAPASEDVGRDEPVAGPAAGKILFALLIPIFAFWALRARRNVPFYFVVLSYSFLSSLKTKISPLRNQLAALLAIGVLLYGLLVQLPQAIEYDDCQRDVPCQAVEFLKTQEVGNIFNRYEWGGFLIWQLPEDKIFVDGRMPAWTSFAKASESQPVSPYIIYLHTLQNRSGWEETLDQYEIDYILISPGTFMDLLLAPDPSSFGWQELFRNKTSVVYKRL